ncbi:predicted protein [Plenodomus lingam JN3]|uniref:Predicted protein n=1 Tax=Leptosphaeria maculans (strain JN3 / isolate v23.1.3 / race Av1-4-5-6-7-8) TaxID=985895 RepID=E4ZSH4_LEPMJ|nr:predicted protein [Plenodomus lingam JN3]CBX94354.1 predicted protein [Plenodomus lingam JN3]
MSFVPGNAPASPFSVSSCLQDRIDLLLPSWVWGLLELLPKKKKLCDSLIQRQRRPKPTTHHHPTHTYEQKHREDEEQKEGRHETEMTSIGITRMQRSKPQASLSEGPAYTLSKVISIGTFAYENISSSFQNDRELPLRLCRKSKASVQKINMQPLERATSQEQSGSSRLMVGCQEDRTRWPEQDTHYRGTDEMSKARRTANAFEASGAPMAGQASGAREGRCAGKCGDDQAKYG